MSNDARQEYVCDNGHEISTPPNHKPLKRCPAGPCGKPVRRVGAGSRKANSMAGAK